MLSDVEERYMADAYADGIRCRYAETLGRSAEYPSRTTAQMHQPFRLRVHRINVKASQLTPPAVNGSVPYIQISTRHDRECSQVEADCCTFSIQISEHFPLTMYTTHKAKMRASFGT